MNRMFSFRSTEETLSPRGAHGMRRTSTGSTIQPFGRRFVIIDDNPFRKAWNLVVAALLVYTGTIFPYKLCFFEFGMPQIIEQSAFWQAVDTVVDVLFWFDLVMNFFCSYQDQQKEVVILRKIVCKYMKWHFWLNLIACLPPSSFMLIAAAFADESSSDSGTSLNQATRLLRIHRLTRLVRLGRLARLGRMLQFLSHSPFIRSLRSSNGMRIMTLIVGLLWVVHLVGCGWFLCASLHENHLDTWVARRDVNQDNPPLTLLDCEPGLQWCHASYFTLTVFSTVGFGDMSAMTSGEIAYVCFTMILGAIINSIIVGEVINIVTSADREHIKIREHKTQIEAFCEHTDLDNSMKLQMTAWIEQASGSFDYDDACMLKMLTSGFLPRVLLEQLPYQMFGGQLVKNNFVTLCSMQVRHVPPRFSVLLALKVYQISFASGEFVYHYNDHPFTLFLVRSGVFAHVAKVGVHAGYHEVPGAVSPVLGKKSFSNTRSRSAMMIKKMSSVIMPGTADPNEVQQAYNHALSVSLFPYKLLCKMSYFGDAELITGKPRQTTVRCESTSGGLLLGLHKHDFFDMMREYPHFARAWRISALRHDRQNRQAMATIHQNNYSQNHRALAGGILLRFMQRFRQKRDPRSPTKRRFCSWSSPKQNKSTFMRNFKEATTLTENAILQNQMVHMQEQMSNIHRVLQHVIANQEDSTEKQLL